MDPATMVTLLQPAATSLAENLFSGLYETTKTLAKRYVEAQAAYHEEAKQQKESLEKLRMKLLQTLTEYQNRIIQDVVDPALICRLVPHLLEQGVALFAARTEDDIAIVQLSTQTVGSMLDHNDRRNRSRRDARRLMMVCSVATVCLLVALILEAPHYQLSTTTVVPLLNIPLCVVLWSAIGSMGAMLYRFNKSADAELADPLRWCFTRPLTGILMGVIAFLVLKIGGVVMQSSTSATSQQQEFIWLLAFLAGFSDRFSDSVLRTLSGKFGSDRQGDLISMDGPLLPSVPELHGALTDAFGWAKNAGDSAAKVAKSVVKEAGRTGRRRARNPAEQRESRLTLARLNSGAVTGQAEVAQAQRLPELTLKPHRIGKNGTADSG
jgi:hypothetical protein